MGMLATYTNIKSIYHPYSIRYLAVYIQHYTPHNDVITFQQTSWITISQQTSLYRLN